VSARITWKRENGGEDIDYMRALNRRWRCMAGYRGGGSQLKEGGGDGEGIILERRGLTPYGNTAKERKTVKKTGS